MHHHVQALESGRIGSEYGVIEVFRLIPHYVFHVLLTCFQRHCSWFCTETVAETGAKQVDFGIVCLGLMLSADFFLRASLAARLEVVLWVAKSAGLTRERLCDGFRQERQTKEEIFAQPVQSV